MIERNGTMFKAALTLNQTRVFLAPGTLDCHSATPLVVSSFFRCTSATDVSSACNLHQLSSISVMETKMIASCVNM